MPKLKTHKGAAKRFRVTATGKIKRGHSHARHILTKKTNKRKRYLDVDVLVADGDLERAFVVLQFGNLDQGLALAADVDERYLRADRDDGAFDGLTPLDVFRLARRLEQRPAHGILQLSANAWRAILHRKHVKWPQNPLFGGIRRFHARIYRQAITSPSLSMMHYRA